MNVLCGIQISDHILSYAHQKVNTLIPNTEFTWIDGLFKWPRFEVVCLGSCPKTIILALINLKASITTCKNKTPSQFLQKTQAYCAKNPWKSHDQLPSPFWPFSRKLFNYNINKKNLLLPLPSAHQLRLILLGDSNYMFQGVGRK